MPALFLGEIHEELVFPWPAPDPSEQDRIRALISSLRELAESIDLVLCMTVNPGWGGQAFIDGSPDKVGRLRALVGADVPIQVDGGISA